MSDLSQLQERVAKASGRDFDLDTALGKMFGCRRVLNADDIYEYQRFTSSIDSALSLAEKKRKEMDLPQDWSYGILRLAQEDAWGEWIAAKMVDPNPGDWIERLALAIVGRLLSALASKSVEGK